MKRIPNLSLEQIRPSSLKYLNLNACHDPDCGNFGEAAEFGGATPEKRGGPVRRRCLAVQPGDGRPVVLQDRHGARGDAFRRTSSALEYEDDPHTWLDRKRLGRRFGAGRGPCGASFELLSNERMQVEVDRLRSHNGIFMGPVCGACGCAYLDAPNEFVLNGAETGAKGSEEGETMSAPARVRPIHKPCRGRPGARISTILDHRRRACPAQAHARP